MRTILLPIVFLALPLAAAAQSPPAPAITASNVWARATAPNATSGAAYLTLTAKGSPDQLTGAATPASDVAEVHETTNDNGVMKMRPVAGLALPPGQAVTLAPGGYHIMMTHLKHPLKAGDHFPLTLSFAHAAPMTVDVVVQPIGAGAPMNHEGMDMGGMKPGGMNMGGSSK